MNYLKKINISYLLILIMSFLYILSPIVTLAEDTPNVVYQKIYCFYDGIEDVFLIICIVGVIASSIAVIIGKMSWPGYSVTIVGVILMTNAKAIVESLGGEALTKVIC